MQIKYGPNKITNNDKTINLDNKITTLIGENGSGKSTILEQILNNTFDNKNILTIAYSSGLNESFSGILNKKIKGFNDKLKTDNVPDDLSGFYFNSKWASFLIYLAYILEEGKTKDYIDNHVFLKSKEIKFNFTAKSSTYKDLIKEAQILKDGGLYSLIDSTFHKQLKIFLESTIENGGKEINFQNPLNIKNHTLNNNAVANLFKIKTQIEDDIEGGLKNITQEEGKAIRNNELLSFLGLLSRFFIDIQDTKISYGVYELDSVSDGEFQLLAIYSLLDLFDTKDTIFLFDEIDSHLHYRNINKLWENLSYIEGKVITTTHIPDSIINNDISHINVVKDGIIDNDNSANSLINRLGNISDTYLYEKKLASKIKNIVLIDDCTDWFIFLKLAKIKKGEEYNSKIEDIQPIKCGSGFNGNPNEIFGEKKLNWINEFILKNNSFNTKNIFSICDKDECPIAKIDDNMKYKEYHTGNDKKNQQFGSGGKIYYLSWKRREIENYLLSHTLLTEYELLEEVNNLLSPVKNITLNNSLDYSEIQTFQAKEVVQKFAQKELNGNNVWKDYNELEEIINKIPVTEISEDIAKMYDFIFSKIR